MTALPLLPPAVAVIVTGVVSARSVTSPLELTETAVGLLLLQVKLWPLSVLPPASLATAASCTVPLEAMVAVAGVTATEATATGAGAVTVTAALPLFPPLLAEMVAVPAVTAVTSPLADTVATAVLLLLQAKLCPAGVLPAASFATAVSCEVPPTVRLAVAGVTATDATVMTVPHVVRLKLHSDIVPPSVFAPQFASDVAPLCSLRNA